MTGYSVEMVLELTAATGWRLLDSRNRQSDNGLYIDPTNNLDVFSNGGSSAPFLPNTFFDIGGAGMLAAIKRRRNSRHG